MAVEAEAKMLSGKKDLTQNLGEGETAAKAESLFPDTVTVIIRSDVNR